MVVGTVKQSVEDHVLDIMEDMLEIETKPWYRKLGGYCRESCHMCIDINIEEGNIYEVCQLDKQTEMSYKMVQYLTHASE